MNTINQRIKYAIEKHGISGRQAAVDMEIDYRQFNNWLNQTKPSIEGLQKIVKYFPDLNARWLLTGEGIFNEPETEMVSEPVSYYSQKIVSCPFCSDKERVISAMQAHIDTLISQVKVAKKESSLTRSA